MFAGNNQAVLSYLPIGLYIISSHLSSVLIQKKGRKGRKGKKEKEKKGNEVKFFLETKSLIKAFV